MKTWIERLEEAVCEGDGASAPVRADRFGIANRRAGCGRKAIAGRGGACISRLMNYRIPGSTGVVVTAFTFGGCLLRSEFGPNAERWLTDVHWDLAPAHHRLGVYGQAEKK
jgi:hypothetical protein